eukprot:jgi/Mesvir1/12368/Mv00551-RA.1
MGGFRLSLPICLLMCLVFTCMYTKRVASCLLPLARKKTRLRKYQRNWDTWKPDWKFVTWGRLLTLKNNAPRLTMAQTKSISPALLSDRTAALAIPKGAVLSARNDDTAMNAQAVSACPFTACALATVPGKSLSSGRPGLQPKNPRRVGFSSGSFTNQWSPRIVRKACPRHAAKAAVPGQAFAAVKQKFSSFEELILGSDKPLLIDFYATWCGPCQMMSPILAEVNERMKDQLQVVKIDTEKYPAIASRYRVTALPTLILFQGGQPINRLEGALDANDLVRWVQSSLASGGRK